MEPSVLTQRVGQAIRAHRTAKGLSQDDFADIIGMHRAYYAAIERGEKNITLVTMERVARGLAVRLSKLLADGGL